MNLSLFISVILLCSMPEFGIAAGGWEYFGSTGTEHWPSLQPMCGHSSQSPIDIKTSYLYPNPSLGLLNLTGYTQALSGGTVTNNGHSAQLNFPKGKRFQLSGDGIDGSYTALQLHFHWVGRDSSSGGSEHTVNGHYFDAEMHIVHIKDPHASVNDIKDMKDGLAVLGVFLIADEDVQDNQNYQSLFDTASKCRFKGDTAELKNGSSLLSLLPDSGTYYRYYGSLTTPPCYETVLWTVYQQPVAISNRQLRILQDLMMDSRPTDSTDEATATGHDAPESSEAIGDNYRPVQDLNGRIVSIYYDVDVSEKDHGWGYKGEKQPSSWYKEYPHCSGRRQSPIDFHSEGPVTSLTLKELEFSDSYSQATSGTVNNNGHSVVYTLDGSDAVVDSKQPSESLHFVVNEEKYRVKQFHFHWGSAEVTGRALSYMGGSEHTVDGHHFPIEMHIVHQKETSDNQFSNEYAVIGIFFDIKEDVSKDDKPNSALQKIADAFIDIDYQGQQVSISDGPVLENFFPSNQSYYRYMGSLTTPPCSETVMWTVFVRPVAISKGKFLEFQNLFKVMEVDVRQKNSTKSSSTYSENDEMSVVEKLLLVDNFRPTQDYYGREVQMYIDEGSKSSVLPQTDVISIVLFTVLGVAVFAGILLMMIYCKKREKTDKTAGDDYKVQYSRGYDKHPERSEKLIKEETLASGAC